MGLGDIFKDALNNESGSKPLGQNTFPVVESSNVVVRPRWFYLVGTVGAGIFSVGALLVFILASASPANSSGTEMATISGGALIGGASLLAGSWIGLLGTRLGGVLPLLGSLAAPLAIIYFRIKIGDPYSVENTIAVLGLGFGLFAAGHMLARGVHVAVRVTSGVSLFFVCISFYCEAMHVGVAVGTISLLYSIAFGGLTATGLLLAITFAAVANQTSAVRASTQADGR